MKVSKIQPREVPDSHSPLATLCEEAVPRSHRSAVSWLYLLPWSLRLQAPQHRISREESAARDWSARKLKWNKPYSFKYQNKG